MGNNDEQSGESSANSSTDSNQKENNEEPKRRSEVQADARQERPADRSKMSEAELLEFYKTKCALIQNELDQNREKCSQLETDNFELTTKIDELREIVAKSNEVKEGLEEMGLDVEKYLDAIDDEETN